LKQNSRLIESLSIADLETYSVWEFVNSDSRGDETRVVPVAKLPVGNLKGRVVATRVRLANGAPEWALIGNVDTANQRSTQHFLTLSIERHRTWFHLARYFDLDYVAHGPEALATFLGLQVDDVFPIHFDLRHCAIGSPSGLIGSIQKEPPERLSRDALLKMAVP
jgi:hypothetical protein